jgi:FkbM family methyltransferase
MLKRAVKQAFRAVGLDVARYRPSAADLIERMLRLYRVDAVFDIGANTGQSGAYFRLNGYAGQIVSFEPVEHLFVQLQARAASDPQWHCEKVALGKFAGKAYINVSGGHAGASSLLESTENVTLNAPDQRAVRKEAVEVVTLDDMLAKHYPRGERCFLKIDVQGYEKAVLEGGLQSLNRVVGLKIELSLVENYKGETLLADMLPFLYGLGFRPVSFENGWSNPRTGELYQLDCILFRTDVL